MSIEVFVELHVLHLDKMRWQCKSPPIPGKSSTWLTKVLTAIWKRWKAMPWLVKNAILISFLPHLTLCSSTPSSFSYKSFLFFIHIYPMLLHIFPMLLPMPLFSISSSFSPTPLFHIPFILLCILFLLLLTSCSSTSFSCSSSSSCFSLASLFSLFSPGSPCPVKISSLVSWVQEN